MTKKACYSCLFSNIDVKNRSKNCLPQIKDTTYRTFSRELTRIHQSSLLLVLYSFHCYFYPSFSFTALKTNFTSLKTKRQSQTDKSCLLTALINFRKCEWKYLLLPLIVKIEHLQYISSYKFTIKQVYYIFLLWKLKIILLWYGAQHQRARPNNCDSTQTYRPRSQS